VNAMRRQCAAPSPPSLVDGEQMGLGGICLVAGVLVYLLTRPPGSTAFLPPWLSLGLAVPAALLPVAGALPTFAHAAAFGLMTAGVLGGGRLPTFLACFTWMLINVVFEIGQHPVVAVWFASLPGVAVTENPVLRWLADYWTHGTFDLLDLTAAVAGAGLACFVSCRPKCHTSLKETRHG
jgi:hypothetical protein